MGEALWLGGWLIASLWAAGADAQRPIVVQSGGADAIEAKPAGQDRTPIRPPIKAGEKPLCDNPPDTQEILRAMPRGERGVPHVYEVFRDDLEIITEKLVDRIDSPRFFPLIGSAQLHHCHWKCTVYFTETIEISYPFSVTTQRRCAEVVYIDKDHLHLVATKPPIRDSKVRATDGPLSAGLEVILEFLGIPVNRYSDDPFACKEQVLIDSEDLRQLQDEWAKLWMKDQPSHLTPYRVHGGVGPASSSLGGEPSEPSASPFLQAKQETRRSDALTPPRFITLNDIAAMAKLGIASDIIVRQIEIENAKFDVTAADLIRLHQAGASESCVSSRIAARRALSRPSFRRAPSCRTPRSASQTR